MPRPRRWLALIMLTGPLAACGTSPAASGGGRAGGLTLSMEGPGEPQSDNFNPFLPTSSLASYGISTFIYEPLLQFDALKPNVIYPWLATSYRGGEYRTAKVTGWPSASDPYDPASSYPPTNEVVLTHLRPVG